MDRERAYPLFIEAVSSLAQRLAPNTADASTLLERGRSTWLNVFEQRHDRALRDSARAVKSYVADQRKFWDSDQWRAYARSQVARAIGLGGAAALLAIGVAQGSPALDLGAVACLVAGSAEANRGRGKLADLLDLTKKGPSDHPTVLRRAGYPASARPSAGEATQVAVHRLSR